MGTAIKHPVPDQVKLSFVILDIRTLCLMVSRERQSARMSKMCPGVKNYKWLLNPVRHRILCSCTHMAKWASKGWRHLYMV